MYDTCGSSVAACRKKANCLKLARLGHLQQQHVSVLLGLGRPALAARRQLTIGREEEAHPYARPHLRR
eukprot:scaffold20688_cov65-Phaeocystis_antarctica.AAC.7